MRWSRAFIPTLRDAPADAEAASHKLLLRGGFARQLSAGSYSLLPLGLRCARKVEAVVREELQAIGGQEFQLPCLHPAELWRRSGRGEIPESFRLQDRRGAELVLGMTHEEVFTAIAKELRSYKQLPQLWFQFQTKFRDEERPKSGLLRVREFVMKDSYSFDADEAGLERQFQNHLHAYRRIFERLGLDTVAVEASSGVMGGKQSVEFMLECPAGEDWIIRCESCGYAANLEKAASKLPPREDAPADAKGAPEKFATPNVRTIRQLAEFPGGAPAERQIKTLVYEVQGNLALVLLRGDHELSPQKLCDGDGAVEVRPAEESAIRAALGAGPGSLGAVNAPAELPVYADLALQGRTEMCTGANQDDWHWRGVSVARDIRVQHWLDLREVQAGEACAQCGAPLARVKTAEVGHIFKLGTKYSQAFGANVLDEKGRSAPVLMGSYGIGVGRAVAAVAEKHHDKNGLCWPVSVAPFEAVVTVVKASDTDCMEAGARIYEALQETGVEVLLDDRPESPGVKFKDAELIGVPYRIAVGPKGLQKGQVELCRRRDMHRRDLPVHRAADIVREEIVVERRGPCAN